ncbi:hypothetical protein LC55x_2469 [Lysobacter capsici]|nr:hypothetical protein LC55x_2469 [Lysobacter capsici]
MRAGIRDSGLGIGDWGFEIRERPGNRESGIGNRSERSGLALLLLLLCRYARPAAPLLRKPCTPLLHRCARPSASCPAAQAMHFHRRLFRKAAEAAPHQPPRSFLPSFPRRRESRAFRARTPEVTGCSASPK